MDIRMNFGEDKKTGKDPHTLIAEMAAANALHYAKRDYGAPLAGHDFERALEALQDDGKLDEYADIARIREEAMAIVTQKQAAWLKKHGETR